MKEHDNMKSEKANRCSACDKGFPTPDELREHNRQFHSQAGMPDKPSSGRKGSGHEEREKKAS